jgi:predicted ATP-grasp superfamily ATP-dependent carboligase
MKILIVGISVRALVESAVHSGYPVLALDAFGDQDLRSLATSCSLRHDFHTRYSPEALYQASRQISYDAIAYTSNLENHPGVVARLADSRPIVGNSPQTIRSVRSWPTLFAKLRDAGFYIPETRCPGEKGNPDRTRRWIIKPILSGGGHGIRFLRKSELPDDRCILQEYVPGKPCSASFVANGHGCVVLGIAEQLNGMHQFGSKGFRYCGNILPLPEILDRGKGPVILEQVQGLAAFLTREFYLTGVNGIDFILCGDRVYVTEVNPRYSASMELIERAYELPIFHLHARSALEGALPGFKLEAALRNGKFFGKGILFAERNGIAPDTRHWPDRQIRDVPFPGEQVCAGNPVCTILASGSAHEETLEALSLQAALLKKEIYG